MSQFVSRTVSRTVSHADFPRSLAGRLALVLLVAATAAGCATSSNPRDPYERFNRSMFRFNDAVDRKALKPAATVYKAVVPGFVQTGIGNFYGNLADVWNAVNNLLQGKGEAGMSDVMRVALNSTLGLGGLLDIASEAGMRKHNEDFGQTLGHWGVKSGPYLMLPILGPSTVRDTATLPVDIAADPWGYKEPATVRNIGGVVRVIDQRAAVLDASNLMEEAALDRYEFVRDSFLQRRESRINDGEGPRKRRGLFDYLKRVTGQQTAPPAELQAAPALSDTPAQPATPAPADAPAAPVPSAAPAAPTPSDSPAAPAPSDPPATPAPSGTPAEPATPVSSDPQAKELTKDPGR
jgi:phospholipid-binding lipoprotein MlaA